MTSEKKIRRRRFSDDFKKRVVAEASQSDASLSIVARRYDLNTNQLFKWKRQFGEEPVFLPVEVDASAPADTEHQAEAIDCPDHGLRQEAVAPAAPLEIVLPCGTQLKCERGTDLAVLTQALTVLRRIA